MDEYKYVAKTLQGLEQVLAEELIQCGAKDVTPGRRAVEFSTNKKGMYSLNYRVYTALRILESFQSFHFTDVNDYYDKLRSFPWKTISGPDDTIAIDATVFNCNAFNNSHFTEMKTKDAVADYFRDQFGRRPSVSLDNPTLLINVFIQGDFCHISLDTSGTPLYKRGYREMLHEASINEVLAAGLIRMSGWSGEGDFYDPMCGAATIPIEAAMYASGLPSGFYRSEWGFMKWKTFEPDLWKQVKEENQSSRTKQFRIFASDISAQSLRLAHKNIARARMMKTIQTEQSPFERLKPKGDSGILLFNPPYNVRIAVTDMIEFYKNIGNHLKHNFTNHKAWVISSDETAIKHIGLKPSAKFNVMNGQLESKFRGFSLY